MLIAGMIFALLGGIQSFMADAVTPSLLFGVILVFASLMFINSGPVLIIDDTGIKWVQKKAMFHWKHIRDVRFTEIEGRAKSMILLLDDRNLANAYDNIPRPLKKFHEIGGKLAFGVSITEKTGDNEIAIPIGTLNTTIQELETLIREGIISAE